MGDNSHEHVWMRLYRLLMQGVEPHPSVITAAEQYRGPMGQTFLHWLCLEGDVACIERFITAGIDLDGQDELGNTALMEVAAAGRWDVARALIAAGASSRIVNFDGEDLADYLELYGVEVPADIPL